MIYKGHQSNGKWVCGSTDAPNGWGCGYVYGFRVPLLVVSNWTPSGYVSGATTAPTYPPLKEWTHDFGSILKFTENNFLGPNAAIAQPGPTQYTYADQNSLDTGPNGNWIPLWDFFLGPQRGFTQIQPVDPNHNANYFMNYYANTNSTPIGPEDGDPND